jgi:hypothetical protein
MIHEITFRTRAALLVRSITATIILWPTRIALLNLEATGQETTWPRAIIECARVFFHKGALPRPTGRPPSWLLAALPSGQRPERRAARSVELGDDALIPPPPTLPVADFLAARARQGLPLGYAKTQSRRSHKGRRLQNPLICGEFRRAQRGRRLHRRSRSE